MVMLMTKDLIKVYSEVLMYKMEHIPDKEDGKPLNQYSDDDCDFSIYIY